MLEELEERRTEIIKKAEEYKVRRTELNSEASKWSELRDELNGRIKEAVERAKGFKQQREEYERLIASKKTKRGELNRKASSYYVMVEKQRKRNDMQSIQAFEGLRERIAELELRQQVEVLSKDKEKKLVARITELRREFDRMEKELEKDKKLTELLKKAQKYRVESDKYHEEVINLVKVSHECHDKMVDCFKEADRIREKADEAHRLFLEVQQEADEAHKRYIRSLRDTEDFDRVISGLRRKIREDWGFRERMEARKKAKSIYEKFREGEKISTEDLLLLQRSEMGLK
ncbi:MAG TPA: phosphoserine phosphatase [Candidatus Bathyarchaeia archaeon]|nr:phosphoserine phosphatase [Candidatus Bathyarchaeia archaeon]